MSDLDRLAQELEPQVVALMQRFETAAWTVAPTMTPTGGALRKLFLAGATFGVTSPGERPPAAQVPMTPAQRDVYLNGVEFGAADPAAASEDMRRLVREITE